MKARKRAFSFCMVLAMLFSMLVFVPSDTYAAGKSFEEGQSMQGLNLQFFVQLGSSGHWITYDQATPVFGKTTHVTFKQEAASIFAEATPNIDRIGLQIGDGEMEIGETAAVHYRISGVNLKFKTHDALTIRKAFDDEVLWKCETASWGKKGNSTDIILNDFITTAFPDVALYDLLMDLDSLEMDYQVDYYEFGATAPRKKVASIVDKVLDNMGAGITISNALDNENATGSEITEAMIDAYKDAGIKSIRILVNIDSKINASYSIDSGFMEKLFDLVTMITKKDMYVIISLDSTSGWADPIPDNAELGKKHMCEVWTAFAKTFKIVDSHVLFELLNKPKAAGFAVSNADIRATLSDWYQATLKAIRAVGGKNTDRVVVLVPYGGMVSYMKDITLPGDENFVLGGKSNSPYGFTTAAGGDQTTAWSSDMRADVRGDFTLANKAVAEDGIRAIITDFAATDKGNYAARVEYAFEVGKLSKEFGYPAFWTDNGSIVMDTTSGFGIINRTNNTVVFPSILDALAAAATGQQLPLLKEAVYPEGYLGEVPTEGSGNPAQTPTQTPGTSNPEQPQKNKTAVIIVAVIAAVILLGAVIVLMVVFKKRNGSFL